MPHRLFPMQKSAFTRFLNSCTSCSHFSTVMFNFTGQLDWPKGSAHSGQNMISRYVYFGCFWKRLAFESVACIREMTLIRICGHPPIYWRHEGNQNLEGGKLYSLAGASVFSCLGAPGSETRTYTIGSLVFNPYLWPGMTPLALLGLQLAGSRSWGFSASVSTWANLS